MNQSIDPDERKEKDKQWEERYRRQREDQKKQRNEEQETLNRQSEQDDLVKNDNVPYLIIGILIGLLIGTIFSILGYVNFIESIIVSIMGGSFVAIFWKYDIRYVIFATIVAMLDSTFRDKLLILIFVVSIVIALEIAQNKRKLFN